MRFTTVLTLALMAAACSSTAAEDPRVPTGSTTLVADKSFESLFAVNVDEDTISRFDVDSESVQEFDVGDEPTRITRVGDRLLVTLRGERAIAEVDANTGELIRKVDTGPEPFGIVATEDGNRVYVAVSMAGVVEERDGETLEVLRSFEVPGEPRWLAVHQSGKTLYIGSAFGQQFHALDLENEALRPVPLPSQKATVFGAPRGPGPFEMAGRVTGDPGVGIYGHTLAMPVFYVDNTSGEPSVNGGPSVPYYAPLPNKGPGRFNGGIVLFKTTSDGSIENGSDRMVLVSDFESSGRLTGDPMQLLRSYPTSATPSPDGLTFAVTLEGSQAVMTVDATINESRAGGSVVEPAMGVALVDAGPRGVAFVDSDRAFVHSFLDRTVSDLRYAEVRERTRDEWQFTSQTDPVDARVGVAIADASLPPEVEEGRRLFYSAVSDSMGAAGVSCASCHFDGRNDGLSWFLMNGPRNTPSLAGEISATAPVTWTEQVPTVAEEAVFTATRRMGSGDLPESHAGQIASYIDWVRVPDQPAPEASAVDRGREIFFREDVACASCHNGALYTDNEPYDMYDLEGVNTRSLVGVAASAPYLHDGRANTLRDVVLMSRDGRMGDTSSLSDAEIDDLVAFLESL